MSAATARTAVYNVVNGVSNTGNVYDYMRWRTEYDKLLELFKTTISNAPQLRGFMVEYRGMTADDGEFSMPGGVFHTHNFRIRGILRLDDSAASEKTFVTLVETIINALDDDSTLHGGSSFYYTGPASAPVVETRTFGSVLCHYCEINVSVTEWTS